MKEKDKVTNLKATIYAMPNVRLTEYTLQNLDLILEALDLALIERLCLELSLHPSKYPLEFKDIVLAIKKLLWEQSKKSALGKRLDPRPETLSRLQEVELIARSIYAKELEKLPSFMKEREQV